MLADCGHDLFARDWRARRCARNELLVVELVFFVERTSTEVDGLLSRREPLARREQLRDRRSRNLGCLVATLVDHGFRIRMLTTPTQRSAELCGIRPQSCPSC